MAFDIDAVRMQQKELNMVADEILSIKRKLTRYQEALDDVWKSAEIRGIDAVLEELIHRLNRMAGDLEDLGHDVMVTGEELKTEGKVATVDSKSVKRSNGC